MYGGCYAPTILKGVRMPGKSFLEAWASRNTEMAMQYLLPEETERVRNMLLNTVQEGTENGEEYRKLASRVQSVIQVDREKAISIVRNVFGAVLSEDRFLGLLQSGFPHKKWICPAKPIRELGGHRAAGRKYTRKPCPMEEPFLVNGVPLRFPHDYTTGHPEECFGCQCLLGISRFLE